jgi:hypothetical protein
VAGLDEQYRAQAGLVAGGGGRYPGDPPADDEQIRTRFRDRTRTADELSALRCVELIKPDSSLHEHDPIAASPDEGELLF